MCKTGFSGCGLVSNLMVKNHSKQALQPWLLGVATSVLGLAGVSFAHNFWLPEDQTWDS